MNKLEFTQSTPSNEWTITHNFDTKSLLVDVYIDTNDGLEKILPLDISITDENTCVVSFTNNRTGMVRIIA